MPYWRLSKTLKWDERRQKTNRLLAWHVLPDSINHHRAATHFWHGYGCFKLFLNFANFQQMDYDEL